MCKKTICLTMLVLLLGMSTSVSAATYPGKIGVGISFERGLLWVDQAKQLRPWQQPGMGASLTSSEVDAQGWPLVDCATCLMDYRPVAEWADQIDDPLVYRVDVSGTYKCSFNGKATLAFGDIQNGTIENQIYNPATNTTTFDLIIPPPGDHHGLAVIDFTDTQRTEASPVNTGFTNLKAIVPGYEGSTETFTDEFYNTAAAAPFGAHRFMGFNYVWSQETDVGEPDYPETIDWSERTLPTDATQGVFPALGRYNNAAWEYTIEISNRLGVDCWINVPVSATTNYVTQLATLFENNLDPTLKIYLESANEVWGTGFRGNVWNAAQAQALGLTDNQNHARRTVEIAQIFGSVFGAGSLNTRILPVLCHFVIWPNDYTAMLNYINDTHGPPNTLIYAIGGAPYYSGRYNGLVTVDGVIQKFYERIDDNLSNKQALQTIANTWGLKHMCYEGGSDTGGGSTRDIDTYITAERDPRMYDVFRYDLEDNWFAIGGDLFVHLNLSTGYNRYGSWGLSEDLANPTITPKMQAMIDLLGAGGENNPPVAVDDSYEADKDTILVVDAPGVLGNDYDPDEDPITAVLETDVSHGVLNLNSDGSFDYTPDTGFVGNDQFTYSAFDGQISGNIATVTITVSDPGCTPATTHVEDVNAYLVYWNHLYLATADITIKENCGAAVQGATVAASFYTTPGGEPVGSTSGITNSQGVAHLQLDYETWHSRQSRTCLQCCVDNVTHETLTYNPNDNIETCDDNGNCN